MSQRSWIGSLVFVLGACGGGSATQEPAHPIVAAPAPDAAPAADAPPAVAADLTPEQLDALMAKSIARIDATNYEVDQALVTTLVAHPDLVMKSSRLVPTVKDGKSIGFKIFAIRPDSILGRLGVLNGDLLLAIDGMPTVDADATMAAFEAMKGVGPGHTYKMDFERRAAPLTLNWKVVGGP